MMTIVFFLEEPSAMEMLKGVLPNIIPEFIIPRFIVFDGKYDMEKQLERRIRLWKEPNSRFLILRDQDSGDCNVIKKNLLEICKKGHQSDAIVRIACHELENFYLGDLEAVEKGLEIQGIAKMKYKSKYRQPDRISNAAQELKQLTKNRYQKVSGSRAIGIHMNLNSNLSHSFNVLIEGIKRLTNDL